MASWGDTKKSNVHQHRMLGSKDMGRGVDLIFKVEGTSGIKLFSHPGEESKRRGPDIKWCQISQSLGNYGNSKAILL